MRRLVPLLALPALLSPAAASAYDPRGRCVDVSRAAAVCTPSTVRCGPGATVTVEVAGFGEGTARCGDAVAYCRTLELPYCEASARTGTSGTLSCVAAPFDPSEAVASCAA